MRNTKILKTLLSTTLAAAVTVSGIPATSVIAQTKTQTEMVMNDSQWKEIQKDALLDGEKTAEEINEYSGEKFDAAVNAALSSYYEEEKFNELKDFEANIDDAAKEIVEDYKDAAEEREQGTKQGFIPGEVIICFNKGVSKKQIQELVKKEYGVCKKIIEMPESYFAVVEISLGQTVEQAIDEYEEYSLTKVVSEDALVEVSDNVDYTTIVNDEKVNNQYYLGRINAKGAWDILEQTEHSKVKVAVIDTGVQLDHPDLENIISSNSYDCIHGLPLNQSSEQYNYFHGTFVAGIIGAESGNGQGIAGVASGYDNDIVDITAFHVGTVIDGKVKMDTTGIIEALSRCRNQKVINMSYGVTLKEGQVYSATETEAMRQLANQGVILVGAAGNDTSALNHYPSDYDFVLSVAATDYYDELADFSNYGPQKDICAPGENIYSTTTSSRYIYSDGTSFAAPIISAVVAEMLAVNPGLTRSEIQEILINTSGAVPSAYDNTPAAKGGIVNAQAAVSTALEWKNATMPLEVIGMVAGSPAENTVSVVWGQDNERIASGCQYNVYVNGEKKLNRVGCNYYTISGVNAGQATVKVTAIIGNKETTGVTQTVNVAGVEETTTAAPSETYNVALGKTVTVENGSSTTPVENLVDGSQYTKWETTSGSTVNYPKITIDLGDVKELEAMDVFWPTSSRFATRRSVETSLDGVTWTTVETVNYSPTKSSLTVTALNTNARYVRLSILSTGNNYIISPEISEIEIYGKDINGVIETTTEENTTAAPTTTEAPTTTAAPATTSASETTTVQGTEQQTQMSEVMNLAIGATATASSIENDNYAAGNAIDGSMGTRWSSAFSDGESITIDLGTICNVGSVGIYWEAAYSSNYTLSWSQDGVTWSQAVDREIDFYTDFTSDMFFNRPVRYIRLTSLHRATPYGTSIYEIQIMGTKPMVVEQTTQAQTETTAVETTTAQVNGPQPLEVIGQVASALGNNSIGVVWGQDGERIASGCQYNLYVDGELKLAQVNCGYYVISGLSAGTRTVVFKSVLNGIESNGVTATVNVY
ncbi:MAG: S8 family serine peptidase [Eubacterium sp.]|nr:S8 family serine peptidase [Eubacterium sp.]